MKLFKTAAAAAIIARVLLPWMVRESVVLRMKNKMMRVKNHDLAILTLQDLLVKRSSRRKSKLTESYLKIQQK